MNLRIKNYVFLLSYLFYASMCAQNSTMQSPALIGYWQNWQQPNVPYIHLDEIDGRYNIICVAFAVPTSDTNMTMIFMPDTAVSPSLFIHQMQNLQNQGKKVLLSVGGANSSISLNDTTTTNAFVNSINNILNTYPFDGLDIDIEHGSSILASGTIANPTSNDCNNLIYAINKIKTDYFITHNRRMILTFAPETVFVQGGIASYSGVSGGYLPIIHAFRNDLDYVHVQLYNSGSMYGIDGLVYEQGNIDFIVAMTEAVIQGFNTSGGAFVGLPAYKVAIGLPTCPSAAGSGVVSTKGVELSVNYLRGQSIQPNTYKLVQSEGYPNLGGMMGWSINWDKIATCNLTSYEYAQNFDRIFNGVVPLTLKDFSVQLVSNNSHLVWETEAEKDLSFYQIERSTNGSLFEPVGKIPANKHKKYEYYDEKINLGNNYYRLKMVDISGQFTYSKTIALEYTHKEKVIIFPNPVNNTLSFSDNIYQQKDYRITNIQGQVVQIGKIEMANPVDVNSLSKGLYFIQVSGQFFKFIKN